MKKHKVEFLDGDDWTKVFVDGELWVDDHRMENLDICRLLKYLGNDVSLKYGAFEDDGSFSGEEEPLDDEECS